MPKVPNSSVYVSPSGQIKNIKHCPYCGELKLYHMKELDKRYYCSHAAEYYTQRDLIGPQEFLKRVLKGKWKPAGAKPFKI